MPTSLLVLGDLASLFIEGRDQSVVAAAPEHVFEVIAAQNFASSLLLRPHLNQPF